MRPLPGPGDGAAGAPHTHPQPGTDAPYPGPRPPSFPLGLRGPEHGPASPTAASAPISPTVHVLTASRAASWLLGSVSGFSPPDVLLTWLKERSRWTLVC